MWHFSLSMSDMAIPECAGFSELETEMRPRCRRTISDVTHKPSLVPVISLVVTKGAPMHCELLAESAPRLSTVPIRSGRRLGQSPDLLRAGHESPSEFGPEVAVTVAVRLTGCPTTDGLRENVSAVVVVYCTA
jgi:hypothetical protein